MIPRLYWRSPLINLLEQITLIQDFLQLTSILLLEYPDQFPPLTALFQPEGKGASQKQKEDKEIGLSTLQKIGQPKRKGVLPVPNQSIALPHHSLIRQHLPFPNLWHIQESWHKIRATQSHLRQKQRQQRYTFLWLEQIEP